MNTEDMAQEFLNLTGRLSQLVKRENELLKIPGRAKGLQEILAEKQGLSALYEQKLHYFNEPEIIGKLTPVDRARIKEAITALTAMMDENKNRLEAKIEAAKHVFEIISNVAKEYRQKQSGVYGSRGELGENARQAYVPPVSVGLNQEF